MKNKKNYIILTVIVLIAIMIWNVANEPGIKDLKGNFKEVAFVRNEQNSGPVIRIYAVTMKGEPWDEMEQYGNYMPHTKYGTTRVYFFREDSSFPSRLSLDEPYMSPELTANCIAVYEKDGMSQIKLQQYPFGK